MMTEITQGWVRIATGGAGLPSEGPQPPPTTSAQVIRVRGGASVVLSWVTGPAGAPAQSFLIFGAGRNAPVSQIDAVTLSAPGSTVSITAPAATPAPKPPLGAPYPDPIVYPLGRTNVAHPGYLGGVAVPYPATTSPKPSNALRFEGFDDVVAVWIYLVACPTAPDGEYTFAVAWSW